MIYDLAKGLPTTIAEYRGAVEELSKLPDMEQMRAMREWGKRDLYFLVRYIMDTRQWPHPENKNLNLFENQWILNRCRDIQYDSHEVLNIWSRYHCKSTLMTFAFTIFNLIQNPNETIGIFSVTKGIADEFVGQIKTELETNELLIALYPDRFYQNPDKDSPRWTIDRGFITKRTIESLKDASVRGFGLVGSNFTGHRLSITIWDDAVNEQNVTSSDMVMKTDKAWELSLNVGFPGTRRYAIGTFYAAGDTYHTMANRGFRLRMHPCYRIDRENSRFEKGTGLPIDVKYHKDESVLYSKKHIDSEEVKMGPTTFAIQMLCNPNAGDIAGFRYEWFRTYDNDPADIRSDGNAIILVDPANDKKKDASFTAMWVVLLSDDGNYKILDAVIDRLNLAERTNTLFDLVHLWNPLEVRYERYSFQADIDHIKHVMNERNHFFLIHEVKGSLKKNDRIARLIPLFRAAKIYFPKSMLRERVDGEEVDLTRWFRDREFLQFPNALQKDGLDALSRLCENDLPLPWPRLRSSARKKTDSWRKELYIPVDKNSGTSWMAN